MAISRVQTATSSAGNQAGPLTCTFASDTTSGNLLICVVRTVSHTPSSVTYSVGSTSMGSPVVSNTSGDPNLFIYILENITGGTTPNISVVLPAADSYCYAYSLEYSGLATTSATDTTDNKTGTGVTDLVGNAITTSQAGDLVFSFASQNNFATYTAGTDFTLIDGSIAGPAGGAEQYIPSGTLTTYTPHITSSVTNDYTMLTIALLAAAGGGGAAIPVFMNQYRQRR